MNFDYFKQEKVRKAFLSMNLDQLDGGLDALMQAVVCEKEIGWRNKSEGRRLIIYVSNSEFHHAGDGRVIIFSLSKTKY